MRLVGLLLAALLSASCGAGAVALPTIELPSFDTAEIERLVDEALVEVDRLASSAVDVPPQLAALLEENGNQLPALPSNADEICEALGTPGVSSLASAGIGALIEQLVAGGEVGLVVGLLVVVTSRTCPIWMPHVETAAEQLL